MRLLFRCVKFFLTQFSYHQDLIVQYYREIIDTQFKCALFARDLILIRIININILHRRIIKLFDIHDILSIPF